MRMKAMSILILLTPLPTTPHQTAYGLDGCSASKYTPLRCKHQCMVESQSPATTSALAALASNLPPVCSFALFVPC
ncbi:hypothetical protein PLICRDRAFT_34453 [Plicaturopsis crispa FD-325 SS-3]|nr:hypothetical protein PLICRDRAFT_34453 [Plicaturopsis crispa FD-325 SS-3]